jgi:hypothetical protein
MTENINELKEQQSLGKAQRDAEILEVQRQKESLASSEAALEVAQQQLRNAHLEIEVHLRDRFTSSCRQKHFRRQLLCCYRTAVLGRKQLRKKSIKQKLNSRNCRCCVLADLTSMFIAIV